MTDTVLVDLDPPTTKSSRVVPVLWAAIAILLSTAVGSALVGVGRDTERAPAERLAAASDVVTEEDFAFEVTVSVDGKTTPGFRLLGAGDAETRRARVSFTFQDRTLDLVQDGTENYLKLPPGSETGDGKSWMRLDVPDQPAPVAAGPGTNPLDSYAALGAVTGPIERIGEETVRGEPTVHFRATVDLTKAFTPPRTTPGDEAFRNATVDVWLDDRDRPRRLTQTVRAVGGLATLAGPIVTTVEAYDFGKPVTVEVPAPDDIAEFEVGRLTTLFGG